MPLWVVENKQTLAERELPYYLEPSLRKDLDFAKKMVLEGKDEDLVILIDGRPRAGKSVLGLQIAKYLDPDFCQEAICYRNTQFIQFITNHKKRAVVYDESIRGFSGDRAKEKEMIFLEEVLTMSGQQNLFTILINPWFFDLTKTVAIGRAEFLVHVKRDAARRRGHYAVYDYASKKKLYLLGKRFLDYDVKGVEPSYHGYFSEYYPIDEATYRVNKKEEFLKFAKGGLMQNVELSVAKHWIKIARLIEYGLLRDNGWLKHGVAKWRAGIAGVSDTDFPTLLGVAKQEIESNKWESLFKHSFDRQKISRSLKIGGVPSVQASNLGVSLLMGSISKEDNDEDGEKKNNLFIHSEGPVGSTLISVRDFIKGI